jgi:ketosteroid isomerase-like protein
MERNMRSIALGSLLCLAVLVAAPAGAADWSAAQQDVWKNVEAYWAMWAKGDITGFTGYTHDDYMGWSVDAPMPASKTSSNKWMSFWAANNSVVMYEITPLAILIHGDTAVVHYYYSSVSKDKDGKMQNERGRWTDILVKQGDRWVLYADHGGASPEDDD